MISQTARPLIEVLAEIEDARQARGKRHPLVAILALMCVATLCGYRSYGAIAEWGRNDGAGLLEALGFTPPSAATLDRALRGLDRAAFEAASGAWAEEVLAAVAVAPGAGPTAVAIDGKALRGSRTQGAAGSHLLSAVSQRLGLPLGLRTVDDKTNEIPVFHDVLRGLVGEGRVDTMDALLTQRAAAQAIVEGGGDYVMVAKDNQPRLCDDAAAVLASPSHLGPPLATAQTVDLGHGHIENGVHWVRDVTFDEDRSQVRTGSIPAILATVRTTAIGLFRHAGEANIAAACRRCAAQPAVALALIGLARE